MARPAVTTSSFARSEVPPRRHDWVEQSRGFVCAAATRAVQHESRLTTALRRQTLVRGGRRQATPCIAEAIASAVLNEKANASVSVAGVRAGGGLTSSSRCHGPSDRPDGRPFPTTATKSGAPQRRHGPRDRDRRLRRLSLPTSLALGQVHAAATVTGDAAPRLADSGARSAGSDARSCLCNAVAQVTWAQAAGRLP